MDKRRPILVYRDHLLPRSETFVLAQAQGLRRFRPVFGGSRLVSDGLVVPSDTFVVNSGGLTGRLKEGAWKAYGVAPALTSFARRLNPVLIHAHFGIDGSLVLPLARRLSVPLVVTFHGYDATVDDEHARRSFAAHRWYVRRRARLQAEGRLFIAVSDFIRRKLLAQGFPSERTVVHRIGVDVETFRQHGGASREPIVLFVGRLVEVKGCEHLITAMASVQEKQPQARLVVIGDGPLRRSLEKAAGGTLRHCEFLGRQTHDEVRQWMSRAAVLSVPSIKAQSGAAEGFGLVFAEAQAAGLPVVSFDTGGISEAVQNGVTGLLVPERDQTALARGIVALLSDNALWSKFSAAGLERASRCFDLRVQTEQLEKLYDSALMGTSSS